MSNVTENELKVLRALRNNDFGDGPGSLDWIWSNCINCSSSPSGLEGKVLSGVCGSLAQKGLIETDGQSGRDACIRLTSEGDQVAQR